MRRGISLAVAGLVVLTGSLVSADVAVAAFPGQNGLIVFSRAPVGHADRADLWTRDGAGLERQLTRSRRSMELTPEWSADGTRIAYSRCSNTDCDLWVMNADGTDKALIVSGGGTLIAWPTWSPDETRIAFTSFGVDFAPNIWVVNADGTGPIQITTDGGSIAPEWSPDGTRIALMRFDTRSATSHIWTMDADGTDPVQLSSGARMDQFPDWSPDGTRIVFDGDGDLWVVDADGTDQVRLTSTRAVEGAAAFSPDGSTIVYLKVSRSSETTAIWTMLTDGSERTQITFGNDVYPDWQPI